MAIPFVAAAVLLLAWPAQFSFAGVAEGRAAYARKDYATAFKEFQAAAEKGDAEAQYRLGLLYRAGRGTRQDVAKSVEWLRKAADQKHALAQYNLGVMYSAGRGMARDDAEAVRWFRKAAAQDYALAKNRLGVMYEKGLGVPQDRVQAYTWYTLAAGENQNVFAVANREALARRLTAEQIAVAERQAALVLSLKLTALHVK